MEKAIAVKSWVEIITKPAWRRRLLLGCGIQAFGQLSGVNVINYYGPTIYKLLSIDTGTALKITGISGSLSIVWCVIGLWLLDRVGRIKPLILTSIGMALALLINSVLSQYFVTSAQPDSNATALRAMIAMNFVFSLFYTMTGIISWVYPAEIFPAEIRAMGNSLSTITNWSLNLLFAQTSPIALGQIGFKFFYVFFAFNVIACTCYTLFYPETKGRTLEQMDQLFGDQLIPHALQDPEAATMAMEEKKKI